MLFSKARAVPAMPQALNETLEKIFIVAFHACYALLKVFQLQRVSFLNALCSAFGQCSVPSSPGHTAEQAFSALLVKMAIPLVEHAALLTKELI